jgi:hypothetical protein
VDPQVGTAVPKNFEVLPRFLETVYIPVLDWDNQLHTEYVNTIHDELNHPAVPSALHNICMSVTNTKVPLLNAELFAVSGNSKLTPINQFICIFNPGNRSSKSLPL